MHWPLKLIRPLAGAAVVLSACSGDDDPAGPSDLPECAGPVAVTVSAGTTPTFSWTPACTLYFLDVTTADGGQEIWAVGNSDFRNTIPPGVRYGTVPAGARLIDGPVPLVVGTAYRVFVAYALPGGGGDQFAGEATFTP
jgi:hypothetical protein